MIAVAGKVMIQATTILVATFQRTADTFRAAPVRMIVDAHEAGMSPAQMKQHVIYEIFRKPESDH
jgi:hypothetical protein